MKSYRDLRHTLALALAILILFSMVFSLFISTLSYAQAFEEYETLRIVKPDLEPLEPWVKTVSFIFIEIWHWIIAIVCIFMVYRFIAYPKLIITKEFKQMFKRRKKDGKKKGRQTTLFEFE